MKLFHRRDPSAKAQEAEPEAAPVLPPIVTISLSDEQKTLLETPVDPRVQRLLQKLNDGRAAEKPGQPRRVIGFTQADEAKQVRAESDKALPDSL